MSAGGTAGKHDGMSAMLRSLCVACALLAALAAAAATAADRTLPTVPAGFTLEAVAHVTGARELAVAPNGDLFIGTLGSDVMLLRAPESRNVGQPETFAHIDEAPDAGVAVAGSDVYVGTRYGVWRVPFDASDKAGTPVKLASVRTGGGGGHSTTSVALLDGRLYAGVGSSCNACVETDPTRATIQELAPSGGALRAKAVHIRNAIALAVAPDGALWAGVAGQDELERGHPYEIFDAVTKHAGVVDYGWPVCYENHRRAGNADADCAHQTVPSAVFPAYDTPIGATFYPAKPTGRYAFPAAYAGGAFVTLHGSWHQPPVPPRVAFVPMRNGMPATPVDWADPAAQWREFVGGFQRADGSRIGRPTGIAVGREGSLFVADDQTGTIYRIRPARG
jgi:glucose/arabinose dehydrogenase